jgi:hypothetical protein
LISTESGIVRLAVVGVIKRLNQLKVSRQIRKMANEIQVLREVRNIDNEYEDLVKSATEDEEKKNIRAKLNITNQSTVPRSVTRITKRISHSL